MSSIKFRSFIILLLIFLIFLFGVGISVLWGVFKLSPFNEDVSNEQILLLEDQFNLNDRSKLAPLLESALIDPKIFKEEVIKLNLDILRQDLGKIKIIVQNPVRKTLYSEGEIRLKENNKFEKKSFVGFLTMKFASDLFTWLDSLIGIYDPLKVNCEYDDFYLRIPYLKFVDSIDVFDIQCAFNSISRLRLYKDTNDNNIFIISRSIPILNDNNKVVGVLSVITNAEKFEKKLGNAFNVILAPVLISMFLVALFIYYFKIILTSHANKNWINAKNIAHNLRNKTSAIKYYTGQNLENLNQAKSVIKKISAVNDNLNKLISETLKTARVEHTGEKENKLVQKNNNVYSIDKLFLKIKEMYVSENIEFINNYKYKLLGVESKIFEAISVAIDNAIFWHSAEENIVIKSEINKDKKFINLMILDKGPGIAKKDKKNIFKKNFSRSGSTGIGLYKAQLLIKEQGGDIIVEDRIGGGTSLIFKLRLSN